jgi:hypothetical protein
MKIAILSWGSLITSGVQRGLVIVGDWHTGGPVLPIEFSRISQSGERAGCLTLVIDEQNGVNVPTHYSQSAHTNLNNAILNLRTVERITLIPSIGYVNLVNNTEREFSRRKHPIACNTIKAWAQTHGWDAVIWTSLLSNFEDKTGYPYTLENAIQYMSHLREPVTSKAYEYIRNAPSDVMTPFRRVMDDSLAFVPNAPTVGAGTSA